jgi:hypothetical protein
MTLTHDIRLVINVRLLLIKIQVIQATSTSRIYFVLLQNTSRISFTSLRTRMEKMYDDIAASAFFSSFEKKKKKLM